jgi:hypothetical protein
MVARGGNYHEIKVIDIDGHVYSFSYYMSICDRRLSRPSAPRSFSWAINKRSSRVNPPRGAVTSLRRLAPLSSLIRRFSARISTSLKG